MKPSELAAQVEAALKKQAREDQTGKRDPSLDSIKITPYVTFIEGTPENPIRHIATTRGRIVSNGLISLSNLTSGGSTSGTAVGWMYNFGVGSSGVPAVPSIRLGTGTTATIHSTNQLSSIINTVPSTISGSTSNPSAGVYRSILSAVWNAGSLGAYTITEAALYAYAEYIQKPHNTGGPTTSTASVVLVDRVCSTNNDFTSFTVNTSKPLTVLYTIQVAYA